MNLQVILLQQNKVILVKNEKNFFSDSKIQMLLVI